MLQDTDEQLLQAMMAGDETAFIALYRRWQGAIYRFALRMSGLESVAEDVTQEVFMSLIGGGTRFNSAKGSVASYLFGIARFQVLRRLQKERGHVAIETDESNSVDRNLVHQFDPLSDMSRDETVQLVRDAVLILPPHYREVVVLCELQEMSYVEAASVLGCAVGTVRSRLHRARQLLVEKLRPVAERAIAQA